jgi:hypothetical protein
MFDKGNNINNIPIENIDILLCQSDILKENINLLLGLSKSMHIFNASS